IKTFNDEVRIQALIDENKVNIKESSIRRTLKLDDAEGTYFLANAEIFDGLAKMGYEKLSKKLTVYKDFFSPQWKFLIHTILQYLSAKTTSWNEFSSTMALEIICLATNQKFNFSRYIILSLVNNIKKQQTQAPKVPSPEPSPEHRLPSPSNDLLPSGKDSMKLKELMDLCTHLSNKVLELEIEVIDIKSTYKDGIKKLKDRVDKLEEENRVLKDLYKHQEKVLSMKDVDDEEPAEVEEALEVVKAAKLMTEVVTTAGVTTTAEATNVSVPRRRRGVVIQDPEETTSTSVVHSKEITKKQNMDEEAEELKSHLQIISNDDDDDDDVYTEATPL
nr:ribonuclease H-like domain-containing protein [Tanacetum cinerariifolium]